MSDRIPKHVFVGASSGLFGVCLLAIGVRFYISFSVRRKFGWDDGWLLFGLSCLIAGMVVLYVMMDLMYEMEDLAATALDPSSMPDISNLGALPDVFKVQIKSMIAKSIRYRKLSAVTLVPMWAAVCCVKFSFLALFKKLLRQMPAMEKYWWFVLAYNIVVACYGATVYIISCPYFREDQMMKIMQCTSGSGLALAMNHSIAQMAADILGDLFILAIPIIIIWQIRIRMSQKIALGLTLCLTVVMIIVTATRIIGLKHHDKLDYLWETFWMVLAAEIGLTLVAMTAFRTLYVNKMQSRSHETIKTFNWYNKGKSTLLKFLSGLSTSKSRGSSGLDSMESDKEKTSEEYLNGNIPRATMTGLGTFIRGNGKGGADESVSDLMRTDNSSRFSKISDQSQV